MPAIFPKRFCSNSLTHPGHFNFGVRDNNWEMPAAPPVQLRKKRNICRNNTHLILSSAGAAVCRPDQNKMKNDFVMYLKLVAGVNLRF